MGDKVVYIHKRKDNGKVFYVGIGSITRPHTRRKNKMWKGIVSKYGYEVEVLYFGLCWDEACIIERALICHLGRRDLGKGQLVNMTDGGEGNQNIIYTPEWIEKQRKASSNRTHSEESRKKIGDSLKNKKFSEDRKLNISKSKKGKYYGTQNPAAKLNEEQVIEIRKLSLTNITISEIARRFDCGWTTIKRIIERETWNYV